MSGRPIPLADRTVWLCDADGPLLDGERAATDLIGDAYGCDLIAIPVSRLAPGFLTLSTRIAGEVIQKFVNYGFQTAILGEITEAVAASDPLRDYVRECNRGHHVWFVDDLEDLSARLN